MSERTIADVRAEQEALFAKDALTDDELDKAEALQKERESMTRAANARAVFQAGETIGMPTVLPPQAKGDDARVAAFDAYIRTGHENTDLISGAAEAKRLGFAQQEGTPSAGGYLVPDGYRPKLVDRKVTFGGFLSSVERFNSGDGRSTPWPTVDDTGNVGEIVAEGGTIASGDDLVFGTGGPLGAYMFMSGGAGNVGLRVSRQLLQDAAFPVESLVIGKLDARIERLKAQLAVRGTGSGQPQGVDYTTSIQVELASGNAVTYAKLNSLIHSIDPAYRAGASWHFNDTTAGVIEAVLDTNGRPILKTADFGIAASPSSPTLLGYPVVIDSAWPDIANNTDDAALSGWGAFGNMREAYVWRDVLGLEIIADPYARKGYAEIEYIAFSRADGMIQNRYAYGVISGYDAP